jgi:microcystin-dependent protein
MDPILGTIILFAGNFAPKGWLLCQGQLLPVSQNTALFSVIGSVYGGDGTTTFALPDLRGRAPIQQGQGTGLPLYTLGKSIGSVSQSTTPAGVSVSGSVTLTTAQLPAHSHTATATVSIATAVSANSDNPAGNVLATTDTEIYSNTPSTTAKMGGSSATVTVDQTGQGQPVLLNLNGTVTLPASQQPVLGINYIIATEGIYPSRP